MLASLGLLLIQQIVFLFIVVLVVLLDVVLNGAGARERVLLVTPVTLALSCLTAGNQSRTLALRHRLRVIMVVLPAHVGLLLL